MLPIVLTPKTTPIALMGAGKEIMGRVRSCQNAGLTPLHLYAPHPEKALAHMARAPGVKLIRNYPRGADLAQARVLFIGDLPYDKSEHWAQKARALGLLVNVEDKKDLCDFYMPALVRRGDLLLAISTGGASPALASLLKAYLARLFPPSWGARVARLAHLRRQALAAGQSPAVIRNQTSAMIAGWLK